MYKEQKRLIRNEILTCLEFLGHGECTVTVVTVESTYSNDIEFIVDSKKYIIECQKDFGDLRKWVLNALIQG